MEILILAVGIIVGFILACWGVNKRRIGTLHVVHIESEADPQLFLDLNCEPRTLLDKRYVLMNVDHISTRE